jgi:nucleotide-binding universal stress UspA family protein
MPPAPGVLQRSCAETGRRSGSDAQGRQTAPDGYAVGVETIVVGYDGSEIAERALRRAAALAEALPARLVVVTVWRPGPIAGPEPVVVPVGAVILPGGPAAPAPMPVQEPEPQPEPTELARRELELARTRLMGRRVEAEYVAEVGDPAERLLAVSEERGADLLVVGAREHGLLERLLRRAVDESVARAAGCDVLLVH